MYLNNSASAAVILAIFTTAAMGQITGSGTTNQVPKFTGTNTVGNSAITESNGNVGIGLSSPSAPLDVNQYLHVTGSTSPTTAAQGAYLNWNALTGGWGETDFINNQGRGYGGFAFMNTPSTGGPRSTLMFINGANGNVGIATTNPLAGFSVTSGNGGADSNWYNPANYAGWIHSQTNSPSRYGLLVSDYWRSNENYVFAVDGRFYEDGTISGDAHNPYFIVRGDGNVGIGTVSPGQKLEVNGNFKLTSGSGGSITFADGTAQTTAWTGALCGGDYAESVGVSGQRTQYEPGDVLVIDPADPENFLKSSSPYSVTVAGIYSTKPGVVGKRRTDPDRAKSEIPMAMIGIVPTNVTTENGPVKVGDLLVTSSSPGYAMKGTDRSQMLGAVVGKALGTLNNGSGVIDVLVTLQ